MIHDCFSGTFVTVRMEVKVWKEERDFSIKRDA